MPQNLKRYFKLLALVAALLAPSLAAAQQVVLPKTGRQYVGVGLSLHPGFVYDAEADDVDADTVSPTVAGMVRLALHQLITEQFMMALEADVGVQWLDEHTMDPGRDAASSRELAWQIGLIGRWMPFGEAQGTAAGLGVHMFRIEFDEASLQSMGFDLRVGQYLWTQDEAFVLLDFGYALPLIQGLDYPTDFTGQADQRPEREWSLHRFSLGFQYGF